MDRNHANQVKCPVIRSIGAGLFHSAIFSLHLLTLKEQYANLKSRELPMDDQKFQSLSNRLARLERQNRFLKLAILLLPLLVLTLGATGQRVNLSCDTLTARKILIVDKRGNEAVTIGTRLDQSTSRSIIVTDPDGQNRIAMGITNKNVAYINMFDEQGRLVRGLGGR
jgi:hypothetical protein